MYFAFLETFKDYQIQATAAERAGSQPGKALS